MATTSTLPSLPKDLEEDFFKAFGPSSSENLEQGSMGTQTTDTDSLAQEFEAAFISSDTSPLTQNKVPTSEFLLNQIRLGVGDSVSIANAALQTFAIDPFTKGIPALFGMGTMLPMGARFGENLRRDIDAFSYLTGAKTTGPITEAPSYGMSVLGEGVRMAADPLNFVGLQLKAGAMTVNTIKQLGTDALNRMTTALGAGSTAKITGDMGAEAEMLLTGEDSGVGRFAGSIVGGGGSIAAQTPVRAGIKTAIEKGKKPVKKLADKTMSIAKKLNSSYKDMPVDKSELSLAYGSAAAKNTLNAIASQQGTENIQEVVNNFNKVVNRVQRVANNKNAPSQVVPTDDVPLIVALAEDAKVKQISGNLLRKDPKFRQELTQQLNRYAQNIHTYNNFIFGTRYMPVISPSTLTSQQAKNLNTAQKVRQSIDQKIYDKSAEFSSSRLDAETRGAAIKNLVEMRKKSAIAEMAPAYKQLEKDSSGVVIPREVVNAIYNYVKQDRIKKIFLPESKLQKDVDKFFSPKALEKEDAIVPTYDQYQSLKEQINKVSREARDPGDIFQIKEFKKFIHNLKFEELSGIKGIDYTPWGEAAKKLDLIDRLYYEKVGIPYGKQGIKEITTKKHAEQIAPIILKSPSSLRQFLDVGGDEGLKLAEDTVVSHLANIAIDPVNYSFNPKVFDKYISNKENKKIINQIPGLQEKLERFRNDTGALAFKLQGIDNGLKEAEDRISKNFLMDESLRKTGSSFSLNTPTEVLWEDVLFGDGGWSTSTKNLNKGLRDINQLDPVVARSVRRSMRRAFVQNVEKRGIGRGTAFEYLTDPKNKERISKIMGKSYYKDLKNVSRFMDKLYQANPERLAITSKEQVSKIAGVQLSYLASQFRDRISSTFQKGIRIISKVWDAERGGATDEALKDLLMDSEGVKKLALVAEQYDNVAASQLAENAKNIGSEALSNVVDTLGWLIPLHMHIAAKQTLITEPEQPPSSLF